MFTFTSSIGSTKFSFPIVYDVALIDTIDPDVLFSIVAIPIIGISTLKYFYPDLFNSIAKYYPKSEGIEITKIGNVTITGFSIDSAYFRKKEVTKQLGVIVQRSKILRYIIYD